VFDQTARDALDSPASGISENWKRKLARQLQSIGILPREINPPQIDRSISRKSSQCSPTPFNDTCEHKRAIALAVIAFVTPPADVTMPKHRRATPPLIHITHLT
jgi:isopropylmalate/homocitrate/citramalate synthase